MGGEIYVDRASDIWESDREMWEADPSNGTSIEGREEDGL